MDTICSFMGISMSTNPSTARKSGTNLCCICPKVAITDSTYYCLVLFSLILDSIGYGNVIVLSIDIFTVTNTSEQAS